MTVTTLMRALAPQHRQAGYDDGLIPVHGGGLVLPHLGGLLLSEVTPGHVEAMVRTLRTSGGRKGQGLTARSAQYALVVTYKAFAYAERCSYVARSPLAGMDSPQAPRSEMKHWSGVEAAAFLDAVADDRLYAACLFLGRGFRRGELAGLRWGDVDLDAGRVAITRTRVLVDG